MPAVLGYELDARSAEAWDIERAYVEEADARRAAFALRWQYYDGKMREPLVVQSDGVNDNVLLPKVDQVIDKLVSFLLGEGVTFDASGGAAGEGEAEQEDSTDKLLARIWQESKGEFCQHGLALFGAVCGHCVARVGPGENGALPRILALNPEQVGVFWDVFDQSRVLWYRLQHRAGERGMGKRIDYVRGRPAGDGKWDHEAEGWMERVFKIGSMGHQWELVSEQGLDYCPIVDWQNLPRVVGYYGRDEAANVLALNDALNFAASNYSRIIKHYATPKTVGIGFTVEADVEQGAGDLLTINKPPSEAEVKYLEMSGDLVSVLNWIGLLGAELWASARMPDPQTLKDKLGALTNFGLRLLYTDGLHKARDKRALYGEGFERIGKLALQLAGAPVPERIVTKWTDPLPVNVAEVVEAEQIEVELGTVSRQTAATERGRDWEKEAQRIQAERALELADVGATVMSALRGQRRRWDE
jgi:hypothetical protein